MSVQTPSKTVPTASEAPDRSLGGPPDLVVGSAPRSMLSDLTFRFLRNRAAALALAVLVLLGLAAALAPLLAPFDPTEIDTSAGLQRPSWQHWLGTDDIGRDVFSRLLYGARISLGSAVISVVLGAAIGIAPGILAGFRGGAVDVVISRLVDAMMCIPGLILSISLVAALGPGTTQVAIAVGVSFVPRFFRVSRSAALAVSSETYVKSARAVGAPGWRNVWRHVVPNTLPPIIVQGSLMFGFGVLAEASLSFLGLGPQPPAASWGAMLRRGTQFITTAGYLTVIPGIAIIVVVLAANTVGDGLQGAIGRSRTKQGKHR